MAASLKDHPDALLAFALASASLMAVSQGVDPWTAMSISGCFFILYAAKGLLQDRRKERLVLKEVEKIEKLEGAKVPRQQKVQPPSRRNGRARQVARKD